MAQSIMDNSLTIISKVLGSIIGLMEELILVNGKIIKCMAEECLLGKMVGSMKEITLKTRSKDMVNSTGQTAGNTLESGIMVNSMEKDCL